MYKMNILGYSVRTEILILIGVVYLILASHTVCGCCRGGMYGLMEGFVGANTNNGQSSPYSLGVNDAPDTSKWGVPSLVVTPGKELPTGVKDILNREKQPVPLPEGEMLMFANTPFKPECCPNTYSNSTGCACMTTAQYNDLILRGGNNVPYSEY